MDAEERKKLEGMKADRQRWKANPQDSYRDECQDDDFLISHLEAAEATCQSLLDQSSRWEAQVLEAGGRIAELEVRIKNLWERECHDDKTVFVCQDGSGAICVSYWGKLKMLEARVRRYQEKADAVYRYTSAKPPKTDAMMAILTELSLEGEARADAALAGKPGEGGEQAKAELLNALAVVTLLRLARGRMQHIIETAAVAMTHAEVRMTQDVIAQIDAAFAPKKPQEGKP